MVRAANSAETHVTLKTVIVDDEPAGRRTLREYCATVPELTVTGEYSDPQAALEAMRDLAPDLLFLDIRMSGMTGIDLARRLPRESLPSIVFVTAYDEYAVQAFELQAIDYLLKPFDEERFRETVRRVIERHSSRSPGARTAELDALLHQLQTRIAQRESSSPLGKLLAESGSTLKLLDAGDIELIEADRNYIKLIVGRDTYHARSTLAQAEAALGSQPMLRISRSSLVNMRFVREVSRTPRGDFILVLAGGATVTSSEGQRENVREYLEKLRIGSR
jgi:two-component system, LytTR family, response regulator